MEDIPRASGIYKITCLANKKIYVGSTINLYERKVEHFRHLRRNKHHSSHLQRSWNKYGEQAFTFEVLELVLPMSLLAREQYWLNKLKPFGRNGFNIAREAGASLLGVKLSLEHREKLRQAKLGKRLPPEHREKIRQSGIGRKTSPEAREKLRQAKLGKPGPKQTLEAREKTSRSLLGRKHTPEHVEKMRQSQIGRRNSPDARERMRQAAIGRRHSPETLEKMRLAQQARRYKERLDT